MMFLDHIILVVDERLKAKGLQHTPDNKWQILEDLRQEALRSSVVTTSYRHALDREIARNNFFMEFGEE